MGRKRRKSIPRNIPVGEAVPAQIQDQLQEIRDEHSALVLFLQPKPPAEEFPAKRHQPAIHGKDAHVLACGPGTGQ